MYGVGRIDNGFLAVFTKILMLEKILNTPLVYRCSVKNFF